MSNISYITTRKYLNEKDIDNHITNLLQSKFGNIATINRDPKWWYISVPFGKMTAYVDVGLINKNRLSFKPGARDISSFLESWLMNELGVIYSGLCGGEFDPKAHWKPDNTKYKTYREYFNYINDWANNTKYEKVKEDIFNNLENIDL